MGGKRKKCKKKKKLENKEKTKMCVVRVVCVCGRGGEEEGTRGVCVGEGFFVLFALTCEFCLDFFCPSIFSFCFEFLAFRLFGFCGAPDMTACDKEVRCE